MAQPHEAILLHMRTDKHEIKGAGIVGDITTPEEYVSKHLLRKRLIVSLIPLDAVVSTESTARDSYLALYWVP